MYVCSTELHVNSVATYVLSIKGRKLQKFKILQKLARLPVYHIVTDCQIFVFDISDKKGKHSVLIKVTSWRTVTKAHTIEVDVKGDKSFTKHGTRLR